MENGKEFKSHDFYLSACLLASGFTLKRLESKGDKFVVFVFDDPQEKALMLITNHWNRSNPIQSRDLVEAINELKTRIHSDI